MARCPVAAPPNRHLLGNEGLDSFHKYLSIELRSMALNGNWIKTIFASLELEDRIAQRGLILFVKEDSARGRCFSASSCPGFRSRHGDDRLERAAPAISDDRPPEGLGFDAD